MKFQKSFPGIEQGLKSPILKSLCQGVNSLWLDDLGAGNANVASLLEGYFEVVKIDRHFFNEQIDKPTFPLLIKNIKRYCDKIVVEGVESRQYLDLLQEVGIWEFKDTFSNQSRFTRLKNCYVPGLTRLLCFQFSLSL